jgi:uncharacterized membrane protein YfcA
VPFALDLTAAELLLAATAAAAGAVVQGTIGFGYALVIVPALLFVAPASVPATPLLLALPMVLTMALRERRAIDPGAVARLAGGRVPGTALGAAVIASVSVDAVTAIVGVSLILTVALTAVRTTVEVSRPMQVAAGAASGFVGTMASLGGPLMGLALQSWPGPALRATLATTFALGLVFSLTALAVAGAVASEALALAVVLMPATLAGLALSRGLAQRLDGGRLRVAVLAFAAAGGVGALARATL